MFKEYLKTIWEHKKIVWKLGRAIDVPVSQLIFHDIDKILVPWIMSGYFLSFLLNQKNKTLWFNESLVRGWISVCSFYHKKANEHHLDYWIWLVDGKPQVMAIPEQHLKEMAVDWVAARLTNGEEIPEHIEDWELCSEMLKNDFVEGQGELLREYLKKLMVYVRTQNE